jgi:DNA-binding transcriptional LysR family regulator
MPAGGLELSMDRIRRFEMFVRAADTGSFVAAARSLDLTPSAVSRGIGELEKLLGAALFHRNTRNLQLTEDGQRLYQQVIDLLDRLSALESSVAPNQGSVDGTVRVGLSAALNRHVVMPRLAPFLGSHPALRLEFRMTQDARALRTENIDVLLHVGEPPPSSLVAVRLGQGRPHVYASPGYLQHAGEPLDPDDLGRHRCLVFRPPWQLQPIQTWTFERHGMRKSIQVTPALVADDREGLLTGAIAGAGLVYLAAFDPALIVSGQLRRVLPDWSCANSFNIYAMYRRGSSRVPRVAAFLQFLHEAFVDFDPHEVTIAHVSLANGALAPPPAGNPANPGTGRVAC